MHNSVIFQQYICYTTLLNMFRTARCSSSGGPIYHHSLTVTVGDFLLHFACVTSLLSVQRSSASILGLHLLWYRFTMVEVKWLSVVIAHCPQIFLEEV